MIGRRNLTPKLWKSNFGWTSYSTYSIWQDIKIIWNLFIIEKVGTQCFSREIESQFFDFVKIGNSDSGRRNFCNALYPTKVKNDSKSIWCLIRCSMFIKFLNLSETQLRHPHMSLEYPKMIDVQFLSRKLVVYLCEMTWCNLVVLSHGT